GLAFGRVDLPQLVIVRGRAILHPHSCALLSGDRRSGPVSPLINVLQRQYLHGPTHPRHGPESGDACAATPRPRINAEIRTPPSTPGRPPFAATLPILVSTYRA